MRNLNEININERGEPVKRSSPTKEIIKNYEKKFNIKLDKDHLSLLIHSNGGHPEFNTFIPLGEPKDNRWSINTFYFLDSDRDDPYSLWQATITWQKYIGEKSIPFAEDEGGNQFCIDPNGLIFICIHDQNFKKITVAPSFETFINLLEEDPDMI